MVWIALLHIHHFEDDQIRVSSALNGTAYHNVDYQRQITKHKNNINVHFY